MTANYQPVPFVFTKAEVDNNFKKNRGGICRLSDKPDGKTYERWWNQEDPERAPGLCGKCYQIEATRPSRIYQNRTFLTGPIENNANALITSQYRIDCRNYENRFLAKL